MLLLLVGPGKANAIALEIIPPAPRYQETVVTRIVFPEGISPLIYGGTARMEGNTVARYKGSYWAGPYGARSDRTVEGSGQLTCSDAFNGQLDFFVNGVRIVKPLTRLPIE